VVVPVLSDDGFRMECFDAADVSAGPVGVLAGPNREQVPFILHAIWMESPEAPRDADRLRFADDIDPAALDALEDADRRVVLEVADELAPA
jgi:hypothetical protein